MIFSRYQYFRLPLLQQIKFGCSQTTSRTLQLLRKSQKFQQNIHVQLERIKQLEEQVKEEDKKLSIRNKQIHDLRVQLTNDIKKGDQIWAKTKKVKQNNIKESVQNFAAGLVQLSHNLGQIKKYQSQKHSIQLRQGFQLTHRLFFSTLEKFKITRYVPENGVKLDKKKMHVVQEIQTQDNKKKGTVVEVCQDGWQAQGKVIKKAQIKVYK